MSNIRGPNSALTEFLRSQGINATDIRNRYQARQQQQEQQQEEFEAQQPGIELPDDPEVRAIAEAAAAKRKADYSVENEGTDKCAYCNQNFTLSVYTPTLDNGGVLCRSCGAKDKQAKTRKPGVQARKKQKMMANALLDQKNEISPSLQDICISKVALYIDDIDELGDLTASNFQKIANILTKNRRLGPRTVQLFLRPEVTTLNLADCSQLLPESYNLIAAMCPNLERLTLGMCGQLGDEALERFCGLKNLESLTLDGPFQVRADAWMDFFQETRDRLKDLEIRSVYRVTAEVLATLVTECSKLERLSLAQLSQLTDSTPFYLLGELKRLKHLQLAEMEPGVLTDEPIIATLETLGPQLETLVLKSAEITDATIDALAKYCKNLQRLELVNATLITDQAVSAMFNTWTANECNQQLSTISFERCIGVGDSTIESILSHCHGSLVDLSLNSLKLMSPELIEPISKLPNLTRLDIGFVGSIEPYHVYKLSTAKLKVLLVFGNIRLSRMPLPENLTVVGTM